MATPSQFVAAARSMLGLRFAHQGRSPTLGVDCAGLAICAARAVGIEPEHHARYQRNPDASDFVAMLLRNGDAVAPGDERAGDMWLFKIIGQPQHLAIQTEVAEEASGRRPKMIHAYAPLRKVVEHDIDDTWRKERHLVVRLRFEEEK